MMRLLPLPWIWLQLVMEIGDDGAVEEKEAEIAHWLQLEIELGGSGD
jgi:hypothetical protein